MPQTNEGALLFIGAIFFLIGILGGGFEVSAIKIPSVGKLIRTISGVIGVIFMGIAVCLYIFPLLYPQSITVASSPIPPTFIAVAPPPATIQPSETPMPVTSTAPPSTTPPVSILFLSYRKPVTASSIEGPDHPAENAVDGDANTRWASVYSENQWIQVDLGAVYHINRVVLDWEAAYGVAYKIQISSDVLNWETIYSTTTGDGGIDYLNVYGSGRYVRMYGTSRAIVGSQAWGYSLYEFEVYGTP